ncbi:MAG: hypothetical protein OEZ59_03720, partial [Deltaproteobacteria bacterium]|nr:hypothetical protein [Deltaproteobacteria bacterium]
QLCLVEDGVWSAFMPVERLSHPHPGGASRLRKDDTAPSRSALKLEEAFELMGEAPLYRSKVVDLGAAPGGWSQACLKRGANVLAVDNGPLRTQGWDDLPGMLEHHRGDGLTYRPPRERLPVDWLLSDMLVAPGVCLGLLRRWLGEGWCSRFVVNVKIPQKNPLAALDPLLEYLGTLKGWHWQARQLFHDRREVTLMGVSREPVRAGQKPPASREKARRGPDRKTAVKKPGGSAKRRGKQAGFRRK